MSVELEIGRLTIAVEAPARQGPEVAAALRKLAAHDLPAALEAALHRAGLGGAAEGIVHLPRLEVVVDLEDGAGEAALARAWAEALTRAALAALARPEEAGAVRFEGPAARLAGFVTDLVAGRAFARPIWRGYRGLRALPVSAALRTALAEVAEAGLAALARLEPSVLRRALAALAPADAERLAVALAAAAPPQGPEAAAPTAAFERVAAGWRAAAPTAALASPAHALIGLLAARPECLGLVGALGAGPAGVIALGMAGAAASGEEAKGKARRRDDSEAEARREPGGEARAEAVPKPIAGGAETAGGAEAPPVRWTPFGGAFLLWPHVLAVPEAALGLGDPGEVRLAALARALGEPGPERLAADPAVAALLGRGAATEADEADEARGPAEEPDAALDRWAADEGVRRADWRAAGALFALAGDGPGYWLRLAAAPGPVRFAPGEAPEGGAERLAADLAALRAGPGERTALVAQIALRRLAWRLPGFAASSVAFLRENVLAMEADVLEADGTLLVGLGPAPLSILLNLTGLSRQRHVLPDGRALHLSPWGLQ